jgi:hypothetical protein
MKRILFSILTVAITSFLISACGNHFIDLIGNDESICSETEGAETTSNEQNPSNIILPLETEDFSVSDGTNIISLGFPYTDLKMDLVKKEIDNNYVGEIYFEEYTYKYYCHEYDDFDLYTSNINYNIKGNDFDEFYISQIDLKTPAFKTYRGVTIGSSAEELTSIYGLGEEIIEDGDATIVYALNNMKIEFGIDKNQKIQEISLYVFI